MRLGRQKDNALEGDQLVGVGRRITEARLEAGMTKMELAEKLGVPLGLFERYEAGGEDPSPHLGRLAQITSKPVTWFRGEAPSESGAAAEDTADADAEAEPEVIEPEEEPVLLPESEPAASNGGSSEPDEPTVEPLVVGDPDPEPELEDPLPAASEPEPDPAPEPEVSSAPAAASAAGVANDDGDDELEQLLSSLGRQREQMAARRKELDERERSLADRESELERRDQEISDRALSLDDRETELSQREGALGEQATAASAQLDADWHEKLQSFEDTNRQYAQAAAALADWAAELRNAEGGGSGSSSAADPESEPLSSSKASGSDDDFPDDF